jgi:hypothetical protein
VSEAKTQPTDTPISAYLEGLGPRRRAEAERLIELMQAATGAKPVVWGTRIVGFGLCEYRYASGRTGAWPLIGFGMGKAEISLYLGVDYENEAEALARLGKHRHGVSCLYLRRLDCADEAVLVELLQRSVRNWAGRRIDVARPE